MAVAEQDQVIQVFRTVDFSDYSLLASITLEELQKLIPELKSFKPKEVKLMADNLNVFFIRTEDSVIAARVTSSGISVEKYLPFEELATTDWTIVVGNRNLLVVAAGYDYLP